MITIATTFYRKPQAKWDRRHLVTVSTHLTTAQYKRLKHCAARDGIKVYRLLWIFLQDYMAFSEGEDAYLTITDWNERYRKKLVKD